MSHSKGLTRAESTRWTTWGWSFCCLKQLETTDQNCNRVYLFNCLPFPVVYPLFNLSSCCLPNQTGVCTHHTSCDILWVGRNDIFQGLVSEISSWARIQILPLYLVIPAAEKLVCILTSEKKRSHFICLKVSFDNRIKKTGRENMGKLFISTVSE